jgi:hypothetical protein
MAIAFQRCTSREEKKAMSRKIRFLAAVPFLFAVLASMGGQGGEPRKVSDLMRQKLEHAQKVLEGIALNDFDKIEKNGEDLMLISKALEWQVLKTPGYEVHSNQFRRAVEGLIEKAKDKNLDGAALSYVEVTLTCVKCHKYVRESRMTWNDPDQPDPLPGSGGR